MVRMHDIRRTKADVKAETKAQGKDGVGYVPPEDDGVRIDLEHHHLEKMGLGGDLKSGDAVHFHGRGTVERSESRSTPEGDRHSATIRISRAGMDQETSKDDERSDLRGEIEKNAKDED